MICEHGLEIPDSLPYQSGRCRLCFNRIFLTLDQREAKASLRPAAASAQAITIEPSRPDCYELGQVVGKTSGCGTHIRACAIHGRCTTEKQKSGVACCLRCDEYRGPDPLAIEPETPEIATAIARLDGPIIPLVDAKARQSVRDAWCSRPAVQSAYRIAARRFLNSLQDYPDDRDGRGVVLCGGGPKYAPGIYLHIRLLRESGCDLPVQVWHRGNAEELPQCVHGIPGVEVVDAEAHQLRDTWRMFGGWEMKLIAVLNSGFREVIFSDADNYPVADPTPCFNHNPTGAVLWPDFSSQDARLRWDLYGVKPPANNIGTNGGSSLFDLSRCWCALWLAHWFDMHSDYYYHVAGFGDQDTLRAGFAVSGTSYSLYAGRPINFGGVYSQAGPDGKPLFVHRVADKPSEKPIGPLATRKVPRLPMEDRVHEILSEYRRSP